MSGLKKLLKGKKKSDKKLDKKNSSTGSLAASQSTSSVNLAGSTESIGYLLKEKDLSKFFKATWQRDLGKVKQLSTAKKFNWNETDKEHRTALHLACAKGHHEIVEFLIRNNSDLNKSDSEGKTPLMKACEINNLEIVDLVLKNGAEPNVYDVNQMSAMHIAAANGNADIGMYLANHDAKLDSKDMNQVTPLHLCCAIGHVSFVEFLISEYVQVNCVDNEKRTPLMTACIDGHIEVIKLLLDHEADPTMTNKDGQTAEHIAQENNNVKAANYIKEFIQRKKSKSPASPIGSIHSKTSAKELFSPTAQKLTTMFSPSLQGKDKECSSVFGGPAINVGGASALAEKSEESHSEDLGDNSWGDSDTESELDKQPKGINFSDFMKKSVDKQKDSPLKKSEAVPKTEEGNRDPSKPSENVLKQQPAENSDNETDSKWDDDDDEDDEVSDENDHLKNNMLSDEGVGVKDAVYGKVPAEKSSVKNGKSDPTMFTVPPPPPAIDLNASAASVDFDSSMPDGSFSDLPLSDMDMISQNKDFAGKGFMEKIKEKETADDENEESVWDSSIAEETYNEGKKNAQLPQDEPETNVKTTEKTNTQGALATAQKTKHPEVNQLMELPKDQNNNKDDDDDENSEWDSGSALPSDEEPSEEVLPPKTPEHESDFQISSSGDEESGFSLNEIANKKFSPLNSAIDDQSALPKTSGGGIFQTEVISPDKFVTGNSESGDDDDDDEIEKQLQNVQTSNDKIKSPLPVHNPVKEKPISNRSKQLADLGLDIGSDISTVSDPEGFGESIDLPEGFGDVLKAGSSEDIIQGSKSAVKKEPKPKTSPYDAMELIRSDGDEDGEYVIETESESDWEIQRKQEREKMLAQNMTTSTATPIEPVEVANISKKPSPKETAKENKDEPGLTKGSKGSLPKKNSELSDLDGETSSDFSFSQEDVAVPGMDTKDDEFNDEKIFDDDSDVENDDSEEISGEDEAEAALLKQMEFAEADMNNKPHEKKEKDLQIKAELQSIIDRSKSPDQILKENRDLVKQSEIEKDRNLANLEKLKQKEENLKQKEETLQEIEKQRDLKFQKREEELKNIEVAKLKQLEEAEILRKQKLEKKEQQRMQAILEAEKKIKDEQDKQEQLRKETEGNRRKELELEVENRLNALREEEENRRKALQEEEETRRNALQEEEETRRNALLLEEENKLKELEKIKQELENQEQLKRSYLEDQENKLESKLKSQEQEMQTIEAEKQKQNEALEAAMTKLAALEQLTESTQKRLDRQKEEATKRLQQEEQEKLKAIEMEAKIKEEALAERLRKLENEELQLKLRLNDTAQQDSTYEELQQKNIQMKENLEIEERCLKEKMQQQFNEEEQERKRKLSEEYKLLYETLESERINRIQEVQENAEAKRKKLLDDLAREEEDRRRRLSEEGRMFREALEKEREQKLNEIFNISQEDKSKYMQDLAEEQRKREEIEKELNRKTKDFEENKKDLERKEKELLARLKDEISRKSNDFDSSNEREFTQRFHELEKQTRKREQQLQLQLMELRDKQLRNDASFNQQKPKSVTGLYPVDEDVITTVDHGPVQSALMDSLEDLSPAEEILAHTIPASLEKLDGREKGSRSSDGRSISPKKFLSGSERHESNSYKKRSYISPEKSRKSVINPLFSDIEPISSSNHDYTFDHNQSMRFLKGASTPKALTGYSDETAELYEELQDAHRKIDMFREKTHLQERTKREMKSELEELHRTMESLGQSQNEKDKNRLDVDLELQSIKYKLEQEIESRAVADRLNKQLKDQMSRTESKLLSESESRQQIDLAYRKMQSEIKAKDQDIQKLQEEINESQIALETEKDSRALQEQLYQEQLRQHELILTEAQKTSHNHAQALSKLEVLNENSRKTEAAIDILKMELAKSRGQLSRTSSQFEEKMIQLEREKETWNEKLQTKSEELIEVEKKLFQVQLQYDNEKSSKEKYETRISMKLESETNARQQLEAEIASLKSRLENSNREIDRLGNQKSSCDKDSITSRENFITEKSKLEKELVLTKQQLQCTEDKLFASETKLNEMDGELRKTGWTLSERNSELTGKEKNFEEAKATVQQLEQNLSEEKLQSNKLENKLETANQKISLLQEECAKIQNELNKSKEQSAFNDREAAKKQESLSSTLFDIKDKSQEERTQLLLRNEQNNLLIEKLQNQLEQKEEQLKENGSKIKQITQDLQETTTALSDAEVEKTHYLKERDSVLGENSALLLSISEFEKELENLQTENQNVQHNLHKTKSELQRSTEIAKETNQRLAAKSNDIEKLKNANVELNVTLQDFKRQNIQIETDLREEKTKAEVLLMELQTANEARENLEELLNNTKSNNVLLEGKLQSETLNRSQREREADEHKGLWESEVKSRSKLGLQLIEMDKKMEEMKHQVEEEKRKARKMAELKKTGDNKLELYEQRSTQYQKEISALRNKLKQYQRRVKSYENGTTGVTAMRAEFQGEKEILATTISNLRRQLEGLSNRLSHEQEMKETLEKNYREQMKEITDLRTKEKVHAYELEKLDSRNRTLENDLEKLKKFYEEHYIAQDNIEEFKQSLETKCRLDLNKKLQEVNLHLEEQALAREAFDKIRNDKDVKTRMELENTITDLKTELSHMRTSLHIGLAKRDTSQSEAKRYRDLFESERSNYGKLSGQLQKTTDRLNTERSRVSYLVDETINKSNAVNQQFEESPISRNRSVSPRYADELDFNTSTYRSPKIYSTPTALGRSRRMHSPEKELFLSSIKHRNTHLMS